MADGFPQIRHVVLLMLENRSFDHLLGGLPGVDGATPGWSNVADGIAYAQKPLDWADPDARTVSPDPKHETPNVLRQLAGNNGGFVADYAALGTTPAQRQKIMSYYPNGSLAPLHTLATSFAVCERWHASVPGPTWTNRLFAMSGTSRGRVVMPGAPGYDQPSVFRRLFEAGRTSRVFYGDVPLALLLDDQRVGVPAIGYDPKSDYYPMFTFKYHADDDEDEFPEFVLIEPTYAAFANDDHPPHDPIRGQRLITEVYNALRANAPLWRGDVRSHEPAPGAHREVGARADGRAHGGGRRRVRRARQGAGGARRHARVAGRRHLAAGGVARDGDGPSEGGGGARAAPRSDAGSLDPRARRGFLRVALTTAQAVRARTTNFTSQPST